MRIGVVSDTHGKAGLFREALEQMGEIDLLIHAGDNYNDALGMAREKGIKVIAVVGNCDWFVSGPEEEEVELEGRRILVTHGHMYGVKTGNSQLVNRLREGNYDLVIYGHSHVPEITCLPEGYLFNPGSVSLPRGHTRHSYGIVEIDKSHIAPYIHEIKR